MTLCIDLLAYFLSGSKAVSTHKLYWNLAATSRNHCYTLMAVYYWK